MKKEQVMDLMNAMPADLIEEADLAQPVKRRLPRVVRTGLIAACLCAALLGTAGAVAVANGVHIKWLDGLAVREEDRSGYAVTDEGLTKFPLSCFSEAVLALGEEPDENGWNHGKKYFSSWAALEQFVGMNIYDNPVLDGAQPGPTINKKGNLALTTGGYGENMQSVLTMSTYRVDKVELVVNTATYTEMFRSEEPTVAEGFEDQYEAYKNAVLIHGVGEDEQLAQEEIYVARCGVPVTIMRHTADYGTRFYSYFILNGILISVDAEISSRGYSPDTLPGNSAQALEVLKTVLDGFN